jgi:hypothetical protein
MNTTMLCEMLPQVTATMIHTALPQMNATTNAVMSPDEHHHAPRTSMLYETWPLMVQVEDERLPARCSTPASTRALT